MTLLRELQRDAVDSSVELTTLLRKARVLGARLKHSDFVSWIQHELDGYPPDSELPEYRVIDVEAKADLIIGWTRLHNTAVIVSKVPEQYRDWATVTYIRSSVSELAAMIAGAKPADGACLQSPWPQELAIKYGGGGYGDGREIVQCLRAWQELGVPAVVGILETVRNRLLEFFLDIEAEAPDAGEAAPGEAPIPEGRVTQIFQTNIFGGVAHIAASDSRNVSNSVNVGSMGNSQILQAGAHSAQSVSFSPGSQERSDLEELMRRFSEQIGELKLDDTSKRRAEVQIQTIEAQLGDDEPDSLIIAKAGTTLRNITEGAISNLVAAAVQPTVWNWVLQAMAALFPGTPVV